MHSYPESIKETLEHFAILSEFPPHFRGEQHHCWSWPGGGTVNVHTPQQSPPEKKSVRNSGSPMEDFNSFSHLCLQYFPSGAEGNPLPLSNGPICTWHAPFGSGKKIGTLKVMSLERGTSFGDSTFLGGFTLLLYFTLVYSLTSFFAQTEVHIWCSRGMVMHKLGTRNTRNSIIVHGTRNNFLC